MASYTPPVFNLICDVWIDGAYPAVSAFPDYTSVPCQKYIPSRIFLDVTPGQWDLWVPPVVVRVPGSAPGVGDAPITNWGVIECPSGSTHFYRVRWCERMHEGFPNEYVILVCEQVQADLTPLAPVIP